MAAAVAALPSSSAVAQVATLGKGHSYFVNNGLQIWGLDQGANQFNYANLAGANFNGVMWSWEQAGKVSQIDTAQNQRWGKWTDPNGHPATALTALEQTKAATLMALQVGDEQQTDLENPNGVTKAWFQAEHAAPGPYFPNQLLYVNSFYINDDGAYANFIAQANPDAISFDSYPFDEPYGSVILPNNWLALAGRFRRHALSSYATYNGVPIGSNAPRPYGLYLQTYAASEGPGRATRHPGDVEMRWQQFTAWTMGFTFVDAFTVGGSSSLFNNSNQNDITGDDPNNPSDGPPRYAWFKESARQSRNLGPALTRLISYGYGPSIVVGRDAAGNNNPVPSDWLPFQAGNAPAGQQFLTSVSATNFGENGVKKNNGQPGDVYVGFFNPLHTSFGPAGETYFMVTNALGAYLDDETATVGQTTQTITLNFDTQYSGVSTLQRLRRSDGQLEIVELNRTTARQYQLQFNLEGGTGDLFKYNDGTPFVGVNNTLHWDNDANAGNNNAGTGAGLGGSGNWDAAASKWYDGSANGAWAANRDAVFTGTAGTVTLTGTQPVNSVSFKSNGYTLTGATLLMAGQTINTDAGVTATIAASIAGGGGIIKTGPGTLLISYPANSISGGVAVLGGVLQIAAEGAIGPAPGSFTAGNIILNGGTLRFGADFNLSNNRGIDIGPAGGTIDTQGFTNAAGYNAFQGGFRGPGDLTKLGSGTFFAAATSGGANTQWKGRLIIKQGTWKIVASDGLPYNVPLADGLQSSQVTLDGGTWQIAPPTGTLSITNVRRGVTVAAGGGTIDTQSNSFTWAGPILGTGTVNKIGSGLLRLSQGAGTPSPYPSTFTGTFNVNGGTLQLDNGTAMGDSASINLANTAGVTLNVTGNETIGSLGGGGASGGNVTLSAITLTTGGNNATTAFAGVISGAGGVTKAGSGTMTLSGSHTYTGATRANDGRLVLANSLTKSSSLIAAGDAVVELASNDSSMRVIKTGALAIQDDATVDLTDNKLITTTSIGTSSGGTYSGVQGYLQRAYNFGTWDGPGGLTTSEELARQGSGPLGGTTTIAVNKASEVLFIGDTETGIFAGQTVTGSSVIAMYTYAGDVNLDGLVDAADYGVIDNWIQFPGTDGYANGDFNFDGVIDAADYGIIDNSIQLQGAPFPTTASAGAASESSSIVAVPEPAACAIASVAAAATALRRRRRSSRA